MQLCTLAASAIWRMSEDHAHNQADFLKAGVVVPLVSILGSPAADVQTNAAGAISALAKDNPDLQAAFARCAPPRRTAAPCRSPAVLAWV